MASSLTLFEIFRQSSSRSDFITKSGNDPNAGNLYDGWKKMEGNIGKSGSSTNFIGGSSLGGNNPIEPPTGDKGLLGTAVDKVFGVVDKVVGFGARIAEIGLQTQMGKGSADDTLMQVANTLSTSGLSGLKELAMKGAAGAGNAVLNQLKEESVLLSEVNTKTGISGELSEDLRLSMVQAQGEARRYGFELSNIGEFYTQLSDQSGKFSLINSETIEKAAPVAAALDLTMQQLASTIGEYEKVGIGAKEATMAIGAAATKSVSLGLNAKKVSDGITASVGMLNQYGFRNGIQGLERMVQKSIEFKLSMDKVAKVAEDVMNPEGAIDMAAKLQVLGGAVGSLGDPIKMMYESTNNMEGLQDSIIDAAKGLATYNKEQGRFEITGINLRRGREMAGALGMTMEELGKTAVAAQERVAASTALMSTGLKINDKEKEFLTNLSRMEGGEMKIVVPKSIADELGVPTQLALDKLDQKTANALIENQKKFEKMNPEEMAKAQLTETQQMARNVEVMATWAKIQAANFIKGAGKAALGATYQKLLDKIEGVVTKPDPYQAQMAGKTVVNAAKNIEWTSLDSWIETSKTIGNAVKDTFTPNKQDLSLQQQSPQKVEHTVNIISNPPADVFAEAARKNAAVGFSLRDVNPREYA